MQNERPNIISPEHLRELIEHFTWLDEEHQLRAVNAVETILGDQMAESKGVHKAI